MMLLPWKKKLSGGGGRFSRLVADLQQQPSKRDGSPAVQSDFPGSFIDRFVKNRDRIKKTAKSRRKKGKQQRQQVPDDEASPEIVPATEKADRDSPHQAPNSSCSEEGDESADSVTVEHSEESDTSDLDGASRSRFLEVAVVAILGLLALFPKWLVIGATIAALSLSFAEFVGAGGSFRPFGGKTVAIEDSGPVIEVSRSFEGDSDYELDYWKSDSPRSEQDSEEIKVCELNLETAAVLEDSSASDAEEDDDIVGESRRRRKLKSKIIKRVVPKKIRSHMKRAQTRSS